MTPPIHDREQAIQTVNRVRRGMAVYYSNPENGPFDGSRDDYFDAENERIVDALRIGQPDPEVEHLRAIVNALPPEVQSAVLFGLGVTYDGQALDPEKVMLHYPVGHETLLARAERAEERLRAVEGALQRIAEAGYGKTWASQVAEEALRAVLSEQADDNG